MWIATTTRGTLRWGDHGRASSTSEEEFEHAACRARASLVARHSGHQSHQHPLHRPKRISKRIVVVVGDVERSRVSDGRGREGRGERRRSDGRGILRTQKDPPRIPARSFTRARSRVGIRTSLLRLVVRRPSRTALAVRRLEGRQLSPWVTSVSPSSARSRASSRARRCWWLRRRLRG